MVSQEAARDREIEDRERKLGALMAEKGSVSLKKKTSKVGKSRTRCTLWTMHAPVEQSGQGIRFQCIGAVQG